MRQHPKGEAAADSGGLGVQLLAELQIGIGSLTAELKRQNDYEQQRQQAIHHNPQITVPQITTTNGVADYPDMLGPRTGLWWDVRRITCATFSAGSVNCYVNGQNDSNVVVEFPTAGTYTFNRDIMIQWGQRLIFTAVGVTGNVSISIAVNEIKAAWMPAYLL